MSELSVNFQFLERNAEVHDWVFGAIAEIIDNGVDASAKTIKILTENINNQTLLVIVDNGTGMIDQKLKDCMNLGQSVKESSTEQLGRFGVGFKSGTMRIGRDVLVFTKTEGSMSVGFLSQTWLEKTKQKTIKYLVVSWRISENNQQPFKNITPESELNKSIKIISEYSPFKNLEEIMEEFEEIETTGTKVIIWNLKQNKNGIKELEFVENDILISKEFRFHRKNESEKDIEIDYSLKAYCELLYCKPKSTIFIGNEKVKTKLIENSLKAVKPMVYPLNGTKRKVIFGYSPTLKKKGLCGMLMYYRNRLVQSFQRIGIQLEKNSRGEGVIGIQQADFLIPKHNKQDFQHNELYVTNEKILQKGLRKYWLEVFENSVDGTLNLIKKLDSYEKGTEVDWVQCDSCLKWRKVPPGYHTNDPMWYCRLNPSKKYSSCDVPMEPYSIDTEVTLAVDDSEVQSAKEIFDRKADKNNNLAPKRKQTSDNVSPITKKHKAAFWEGELMVKDPKKNNNWALVTPLSSVDQPEILQTQQLFVKKFLHPEQVSPVVWSKSVFHFECGSAAQRDINEYIKFSNYISGHAYFTQISLGASDVVILPPEKGSTITRETKMKAVVIPEKELASVLVSKLVKKKEVDSS